MKTRNKFYISAAVLALGMSLSSCNDYLDKLPDNRMEIRNADDASKLLISAYPQVYPAYLLETYSDNTDFYDVPGFTAAGQFQREAYEWRDITDVAEYESPQELWQNIYVAIAAANQTLQFINSQSDQSAYSAQKGEALLCRAYNMLLLSEIFCDAYSPATASSKLGIPYPTEPETTVGTTYDRGTLKDVYDRINADIEAGLPLISDSYEQPKYHFTRSAACAFAAQFNLFYCNYDKAISYANQVLGTGAPTGLRDWQQQFSVSQNGQTAPNNYISSNNRANLLLITAYSQYGAAYGPYGYGARYAHGSLAATEDIRSTGPWGSSQNLTNVWHNNNLTKVFVNKIPYSFEYTDIKAKIGSPHTQLPALTTDGTLLVRAEAKALKGDYEGAVADINYELSAMSGGKSSVTLDGITQFYRSQPWYTPTQPTVRKHLNPDFITLDSTVQEPVLNAVLQLRRIMTIGEGTRMQDVKRYGIVIYRRTLNRSNAVTAVTDTLGVSDPRRAIQLPQDVISSGMTANSRLGQTAQKISVKPDEWLPAAKAE